MAAVFPMFMFSVVIIRSVILFKRGAIRDKEVSATHAVSTSFSDEQRMLERI